MEKDKLGVWLSRDTGGEKENQPGGYQGEKGGGAPLFKSKKKD